jgi:hypothetical protein
MKNTGKRTTRDIKRITLRRETIARLTFGQLELARGGAGGDAGAPTSLLVSCKETAPTCATL